MIERRFDVVSAEHLEKLASEPLPLDLSATSTRVLYRDLYIDTDDDQLQRRGLSCRLRLGSDDRRTLTLFVGTPDETGPPKRYEAAVDSPDPRVALTGTTEPARRLAAIIDARLLLVRLELQIERVQRSTDADWLGRERLHLMYDRVHVRSGSLNRAFHHLTVPYLGDVKLFEMPVLGYLGFPPFALECFALYHWLRGALRAGAPAPLP